MSIDCVSPSGVSLWHHGIKGQKWGVRRTPEQIGRGSSKSEVENLSKSGKIGDTYYSDKGFVIASAKFTKYCLKPGSPHSKDFFDLGYTPDDADLLFRHIEENFDIKNRKQERLNDRGETQFRIPMLLGVTEKKVLTTAWQIDLGAEQPRFVTAYVDRRNKERD